MWIYNVMVYTTSSSFPGTFLPGAVKIDDGIISRVIIEHATDGLSENLPLEDIERQLSENNNEEILDGHGDYLLPGFIDMHFHGCVGADFCDATHEALATIAAYEASIGVTEICPATMTLPKETLLSVLKNAADFRRSEEEEKNPKFAELVGINMEGPFISPAKKGAQDPAHIMPRSSADFMDYQTAAEGLVKIIAIAPEEPSPESVEDFITAAGEKAVVSLAHTNADYASAFHAFECGAAHAVHLFNAMPAFHHRDPGVVGAVFDAKHVTAELICDGIHIHPAMVRAAFTMMGAERMILISDSMRATGLSDGVYTLGGLDVNVKGHRATLVSDGALAGSATNLPDCVRTAVQKVGIPLETAVYCATINPARRLGIDALSGSIEEGKKANFVLWDKDLELTGVICRGKRIV